MVSQLDFDLTQRQKGTQNCPITDYELKIGLLHDPVTWYKIKYTGEQVAQWEFQNNACAPAFVLEVPLRNLLTSICNFVPCDRVMQRAYSASNA